MAQVGLQQLKRHAIMAGRPRDSLLPGFGNMHVLRTLHCSLSYHTVPAQHCTIRGPRKTMRVPEPYVRRKTG